MVYASDRGGGGHLHLWVQQPVPGSDAIQLTNGDWDDHQPAFSPNGEKIVFRSDRDGGGLYVVPSLGGQPVLIAKQGRDPRFSPDGKQIAYWIGLEMAAMHGVAWGNVLVVPAAGGEPIQVSGGLHIAGMPVWSEDGANLLVCGEDKPRPLYQSVFDWWVVPVGGGQAVRTGAHAAFRSAGMAVDLLGGIRPFPRTWTSGGILFSAQSGDSVDLWRATLTPRTWQIAGAPMRVSNGTGFILAGPSMSEGRIAFADLSRRMHLWSLRLDSNRGTSTGVLEQVTDSAAAEYWPSVTPDGKLLAFTSTRSGKRETWVKDLTTGKEILVPLPGAATGEEFPRISPDGKRVAHTILDGTGSSLSIAPMNSGTERRIPEQSGGVWGWSPDGQYLLLKSGTLRNIRLLDAMTGTIVDFLDDPDDPIFQASFSPDGRWIGFMCSSLYIAPFRGPSAIPKQQWSVVVNGGHFEDKPRWSPDGNLLYFTSERDGWRCIWAQRLNPSTKTPLGEPWPVHHFHAARRSLVNVGFGLTELAVAPDGSSFHWMRSRVTYGSWTRASKRGLSPSGR